MYMFMSVVRLCAAMGVACALILHTHVAQAQAKIGRIETIIEKSVARKEFMGTVLVAEDGKIVLNKAYGFANLEWQIRNTPDTKFRIASMTKQFTAAAILLLEERGRLTLDDPVKKFLSDAPAAWDKVTLFNLLTHTSGIPNYSGFSDYEAIQRKKLSPLQLIDLFRDLPLAFQPGEQFSYSNSGYSLLGYVIEQASGKTYANFLQENIFTPLEMNDSGYDLNEVVTPHRASGYDLSDGILINAPYIDMSVAYAAGGLHSTTGDLLGWELALFGGKVLSAASLQKMTTPYKGRYAMGLGVSTMSGHTVFGHNGGIDGFSVDMDYCPDQKLVVIVLGNVRDDLPQDLATRIAAIELSQVQ